MSFGWLFVFFFRWFSAISVSFFLLGFGVFFSVGSVFLVIPGVSSHPVLLSVFFLRSTGVPYELFQTLDSNAPNNH